MSDKVIAATHSDGVMSGLTNVDKCDAISDMVTFIEVIDEHKFDIKIMVFFLYVKISVHIRVGKAIMVIDHNDVLPFTGISHYLTKRHYIDIKTRNTQFMFRLADELESAIYNGSTLAKFAERLASRCADPSRATEYRF